jgi:hypothetical protein
MADERTVAWDIDSMVLATLTGDSPGTAVVAKGAVSAQLEARMKSGEQPGDGGLYSVVSKMMSGTLTLSFADWQDFSVVQILTGFPPESSGSPQGLALPLGGKPFPYFYCAAKTFLDDGVGNFHVHMLKCKITGNFQIGIADNAFVIPSFTATLVSSGYIKRAGKNQFGVVVRYPTDVALAVPPTSVPLIVA